MQHVDGSRLRGVAMVVLVLVVLAGAGSVLAGQASGASAGDRGPAPMGAGTREWLDAQRGGHQGSPNVQGLPEAARVRTLQRYLDSFTHPIPEAYFDRDRSATR